MKPEELKSLEIGDIIKHVATEHSYVVTGNYGSHVTAVRSVDATNPSEWIIVKKAK